MAAALNRSVAMTDSGSGMSHPKTEAEKQAEANRARIEAEKKRKEQAQKDAEEKARQEAEAARRKAEADAAAKKQKQQAELDAKKQKEKPDTDKKTPTASTTTSNKTKTPTPAPTKTTPNTGFKSGMTEIPYPNVINSGLAPVNQPRQGDNILGLLDTNVTNGVNSTAPEVMDLLSQLFSKALPQGGNYNYQALQQIQAELPRLLNAAELAQKYGLNYDLSYIYDTLMKGVDAGYQVRYDDQKNAEDKYYGNAAVAQNTLADTLRKQQSQAIMTGTNRGMQAANALSTVLGTSQQFAANATQLALDRAKLAKEYAADKANTNANALNAYNAMGSDLMQMGKSIYSSDVSKYVGQLDYNTGVNTVNGQLASQQMASQSAWDTTVASSLSNVYSSYLNGQISLAEAQQQANAAIQQAQINASATSAAASASAQAQRDAASINAAAQQQMNKAQLDANAASTQAATSSSYVTDLINNVGSNLYTPDQGKSILQGYLTSGFISQGDYNMAKGYFDSLTKTSTPTTTTTTTTKSNTNGTVPPYPSAPVYPDAAQAKDNGVRRSN